MYKLKFSRLFTLCLILWSVTAVGGFSRTTLSLSPARTKVRSESRACWISALSLRGGQQKTETSATRKSVIFPMTSALTSFGKLYASWIATYPIRTKSVTACGIFGLSDYLAQRFEGRQTKTAKTISTINWNRVAVSAAVGLFYFGPAAHYWYDAIFRLLPGTSLWSTLQKAAMGQLLFGPSFTCIFFATSLMQSGNFSLSNWFRKIRQDLPTTWLAGVSFWPLVDLVSYSLVAKDYIPLFVNMCSLGWTIYLSMVANR